MITKVVFLCSSSCAFPVCAGTWPGIIQCCRVGRPEPSPDNCGSPVSVCRPKTVLRVSDTFLPGPYPNSDPVVFRV